eukprot:2063198-Rhodomonas_salina.1
MAVSSKSVNQTVTSKGFPSGDISASSEALCTNSDVSFSSHVGSSSEQFDPGQASSMQRFNTSPSTGAASMMHPGATSMLPGSGNYRDSSRQGGLSSAFAAFPPTDSTSVAHAASGECGDPEQAAYPRTGADN